ncbi:MAG: efflux RND transporter periplasmic adaptor subunit [Myxococcota bacterium]|jgi:membrane fusion protein (multidrug efflux system)
MKKSKYVPFPVAIILILFLAPGCNRGQKADAQAVKPPAAPMAVSVTEVSKRLLERRVDITGSLAAWEEATVSIEAEGRLVKVLVDLGDRVRKGDTLLTILPVEYEYRKVQAEAELTSAEADFKRTQELLNKKLAAQQQLDETRRRLDTARAAVDLAKKKLDDTSLKSPIDGVIARRMVNNGEYVRAGTQAFYIVRITPLKFRGDVPERYAEIITRGEPVQAFIESRPDEPLKGKIIRTGASVSTDTRSFPIEAEIENPRGLVKPGSFARLSILANSKLDAIAIPETAVFNFAGNPRVFLAVDGKVVERTIETSGKTGDQAIIDSGLAVGEKVIISGVELLTNGQAITIR